jgi:hypothetical protein
MTITATAATGALDWLLPSLFGWSTIRGAAPSILALVFFVIWTLMWVVFIISLRFVDVFTGKKKADGFKIKEGTYYRLDRYSTSISLSSFEYTHLYLYRRNCVLQMQIVYT